MFYLNYKLGRVQTVRISGPKAFEARVLKVQSGPRTSASLGNGYKYNFRGRRWMCIFNALGVILTPAQV